MAKVNQTGGNEKTMKVTHSMCMSNMSIKLETDDSDSSLTDFEPEDPKPVPVVVTQPKECAIFRAKCENQEKLEELFLHLLEFSEDILPKVLYEPMIWCNVSIYDALKHIAQIEEIFRNVRGNKAELLVLERNLEAWKRHRETSISKSRLRYSLHLYKYAGDVFYFAFHQNRDILAEVRKHLDPAFEAQFGSSRLAETRALLKVYLGQFSQIEDFLSVLPELYRGEVLAGIISLYLNPFVKNERRVVLERINELLSSPDSHENQVNLMMLTREDCLFKPIILDCMFKHMIMDPMSESAPSQSCSNNAKLPSSTTTKMDVISSNSFSSEDKIRHRLNLLIEAEPDLLVKACIATENLETTLFDIIAHGLDTISRKVTRYRSKLFEDFRPPLFDGSDPNLCLPARYLEFFKKIKQVSSTRSLLDRVKRAFSKPAQSNDLNLDFWIELFKFLE